jgi:Polyketide cyclase / dehydrase and lipid transport
MLERQRLDRPLQASIEVTTSPVAVWHVVADLRRTGEWSPECSRVVPLGTVRQGGWLLGVNHRKWVTWATLSRIIRFEPEAEITWKVLTNRAVWSYRLEPIGAGTRIIQTRDTPRGISHFARAFTRALLGGQRTHDDELEAGMNRGLERIKAIAQA